MRTLFFRAVISSFLALVFVSCDSSNNSSGSLTIERDLRLTSLAVEGFSLSPSFSPDNIGPYLVDVPQEVDTIVFEAGETVDSSDVSVVALRRVLINRSERDGEVDEQSVTAGEGFSFSLEPGDNLFTIRAQTSNEEQRLDYLVRVQRVSNVAALQSVTLDDLTTASSQALRFVSPSAFDEDVFSYELSAPFSRCTVLASAIGADRYTQVALNGESLARRELRYLDLSIGVNTLSFDVTSEDGSAQQSYVFTITRAEASTDDIDDNNSLSALSFSSGDLSSNTGSDGFNCLLTSYSLRVDNDQETVSVSAVPSIDGRTVELLQRVSTEDEDGNTEISLENPQIIPEGGSVEISVSDNEDENVYVISLARDDNDQAQAHYTFAITRSERNVVHVATAEALQLALQNAQPNQEIVIGAEGVLSASSELAASGKEGVFFFSSASGTAEAPIVLRSTESVTLSGEAQSSGTVLELTGDYWQIRDLTISEAAYGLVLDSASNNQIENIVVSDIGIRAIQLKNNSDNNLILSSDISRVGSAAIAGEGEAIVIGSAPSEWLLAPDLSDESTLDQNNVIANVNIGPEIYGELIQIHAGAQASRLVDVTLDSQDLSNIADDSGAVLISGNQTDFSYSSFVGASSANLSAAVIVSDLVHDDVSDAWGENTQFYDNYLDSNNPGLPTLLAEDTVQRVSVDDNIRSDGEVSVYSGSAVDEAFASPNYLIQWVSPEDEQTYCLQRETTTVVASGDEVDLITAANCDNSVAQQWNFVADGDGYVLIRPVDAPTFKIAPSLGGAFKSNGIIDALVPDEDDGSDTDSASSSRWKAIYINRDQVYLSNKFGPIYGVTIVDTTDDGVYESANPIARIAAYSETAYQHFTLTPIE